MRNLITFYFVFLFAFSGLIAQKKDNLKTIDNGIAKSTGLNSTKKSATISPLNLSETQWNIGIKQYGLKEHAFNKPLKDSIKRIKANLKREALKNKFSTSNKKTKSLTDTPVVFNKYEANTRGGGTPADNNLAVSDDGYVVSVINSSVFFADSTGKKLFEREFDDFFEGIDVPGFIFDPKVIYDPVEDKFIIVVLSGSSPGNSFVVVMVSQTSNPLFDWDMYALLGDPLEVDGWFDYPSIAITNSDLLISGNLFGEGYVDNLVYQIDKTSLYEGEDLQWVAHGDIRESGVEGNKAFTILPIGEGLGGEYGQSAFMLSNRWFGGNVVNVFWTSGSALEEPEVMSRRVSTNPYEISGNAFQPNTDEVLETNDCRILSGYLENENIHYTHHTSDENGFNQLFYGIINTTTWESESSSYGLDSLDYAFPAICFYRYSDLRVETAFVFLASGTDLLPELRTATVNNNFQWSEPVTVKAGTGIIDVLRDSIERWGDYSGIGRRFNTHPPEYYVTGIVGDGGLSNWIGAVGKEGLPPTAAFRATREEGKPTFITTLINETTGFADSIRWLLESAQPATSVKNTQTTFYREEGEFDVTLIAYNDFGIDTLTKEDFIKVSLPTSTVDAESSVKELNFYPNPIRNFTPANVKVHLERNEKLRFDLFDANGQLIRTLKNDRVKAGESVFQFNTQVLNNGTYFLVVYNSENKKIGNEKIIVSN